MIGNASCRRRRGKRWSRAVALSVGLILFWAALSACGGDGTTPPPSKSPPPEGTGTGFPGIPIVARALTVLGHGDVAERFTSELWVHENTAYTATWGTRGVTPGNAVKIWDVSGNIPSLVDSVIVSAAGTTGDVQVSDDGNLLVVAIEPRPAGGLAIYSLAEPRKPVLLTRYTSARLQNGVHTAEIARVNGVLYAFCAVDPANLVPSQLVIVSLANPSAPVEVAALTVGAPFIHDVFVRNGLLFTAEWNDGVGIYDIGAVNGSVATPKLLSHIVTTGGQVHNLWWYHPAGANDGRYLFVGQEGPGQVGATSIGDIHVVDISNLTRPIEVATYAVTGAGVHNLSMDESRGRLYAAYYNGGIKVLDVRGDLGTCTPAQKTSRGHCDLAKTGRLSGFADISANGLAYVWGVQWREGAVYASDMLTGLWKFAQP